MSPDAHGLVEIGKTHDERTAVAACADDQYPDRLPGDEVAGKDVLDAHGALPPLNELRERLRQMDQGFCRERPPLTREFTPQGVVAALVPRQAAHIGVGEGALVKSLFPTLNRSYGSASRTSHRPQAHRSVVGEIPERTNRQLCLRFRPSVFGKCPDAKTPMHHFPDQWRLRK